jgi:hypothetical protein
MACIADLGRATVSHLAPVRRVDGGVPRVAAIETIDRPHRVGARSETFEAHRVHERRRLSSDHQQLIRYVFCDWAAEVGARSNCETVIQQMVEGGRGVEIVAEADRSALARQCERCSLKRQSTRVQCPRCGYAPQEIYCHPPKAGAVRIGTGLLFPQERWSDDRRAQRDRRGGGAVERRANVLRTWRTLVSLEGARVRSLVVLHALYGDRPPGMLLPEGTWPKAIDNEYRRVVRHTDIASGSETSIERRMQLDKRRRKVSANYAIQGWSLPLSKQDNRDRIRGADVHDETETAWKARVAAAELARKALVVELGRQCERLIVEATVTFEAAWEAKA